jgi:hypothetical protein
MMIFISYPYVVDIFDFSLPKWPQNLWLQGLLLARLQGMLIKILHMQWQWVQWPSCMLQMSVSKFIFISTDQGQISILHLDREHGITNARRIWDT